MPHLQNFSDHFMDRFVEIAAGDVDADVCVHMIATLRIMQRSVCDVVQSL